MAANNKSRDDSTGNTGATQDSSMTSVQSTEGEPPTAAGNVKNVRKPRMKALLKKLQDQVEFYFSDANISKDRFLKQKMAEHAQGHIPVSLIASFNKMKSLTSDQSLVIEAMEKSPLLKLTPDREYVYRVEPLPLLEEKEVNSRTIYVENLPPKADHKRLNSLFSSFGVVTYISLPRHKVSNAIKGFAFIEFATSEEAEKALEFLQLNDETDKATDDTVSDNTAAATGPPVEDNVFISNKTIAETSGTLTEGEVAAGKDSNVVDGSSRVETLTAGPTNETGLGSSCGSSTVGVSLKRKRDSIEEQEGTNDSKRPADTGADNEDTTAGDEGSDGVTSTRSAAGEREEKKRERDIIGEEDKPAKRIKTDDTERGASHVEDESSSDEGGHSTLNRLNSTVLSEVSVAEEVDGEEEDGEKKKKNKMRRHRKRRLSRAQYLKTLQLKAMSKEKWLEMKVLFKKLEKDHMKELKGHVKSKDEDDKAKTKGFVSNCLVKIRSTKDDITPDQLKNSCSPFGPVAYVDFKKGDTEGYVRFGTSGCVDQLTKESSVLLEGVAFQALEEDEEREYFLKTQTARKQHFSNRKRKTTRGHDKLISKALSKSSVVKEDKNPKPSSSHIRFSDNDE
ncbi:PREDICTED: la protein homolog isoform X2 [Amphimedon queenslandica]|uniref:La-related protein 7 n=1 Tax=Amphimedon queenslandica TaxID=400682 RepID=A0A1X7UEG2_AMPQE|nr:PREDICTED: la protein homolog isoform X2 [Amphimedon queenslandica]|eukprot:XP_019854798.1 PREDICTED: la protein homolog isoform X2 [Amphimedon queenslandica]